MNTAADVPATSGLEPAGTTTPRGLSARRARRSATTSYEHDLAELRRSLTGRELFPAFSGGSAMVIRGVFQ